VPLGYELFTAMVTTPGLNGKAFYDVKGSFGGLGTYIAPWGNDGNKALAGPCRRPRAASSNPAGRSRTQREGLGASSGGRRSGQVPVHTLQPSAGPKSD
jgi:hypothetical protein